MKVEVRQQILEESDTFFVGNLVKHKTKSQILMVAGLLKTRFHGIVIKNEEGGLKRGSTVFYYKKDFEQFYGTVSLITEI